MLALAATVALTWLRGQPSEQIAPEVALAVELLDFVKFDIGVLRPGSHGTQRPTSRRRADLRTGRRECLGVAAAASREAVQLLRRAQAPKAGPDRSPRRAQQRHTSARSPRPSRSARSRQRPADQVKPFPSAATGTASRTEQTAAAPGRKSDRCPPERVARCHTEAGREQHQSSSNHPCAQSFPDWL